MRSARIPTALQKARKPEKIEALLLFENVCRFGKHRVDFAKKSCQSAQVHLIVSHNSHKRLCWSPAQIVEIMLWDQRGFDVVFAMPAEPPRIENAPLEFRQTNTAQA